jgi:hypothetical protein
MGLCGAGAAEVLSAVLPKTGRHIKKARSGNESTLL